jgi:hypothetical protein
MIGRTQNQWHEVSNEERNMFGEKHVQRAFLEDLYQIIRGKEEQHGMPFNDTTRYVNMYF